MRTACLGVAKELEAPVMHNGLSYEQRLRIAFGFMPEPILEIALARLRGRLDEIFRAVHRMNMEVSEWRFPPCHCGPHGDEEQR